ncbi:hypothetical protein Dimus_024880, partial [Dionaea muscipula]
VAAATIGSSYAERSITRPIGGVKYNSSDQRSPNTTGSQLDTWPTMRPEHLAARTTIR